MQLLLICKFYCFHPGPHISFNMHDIIIYVAWWWEKYLSKRSLVKHTCSWPNKLIVLLLMPQTCRLSIAFDGFLDSTFIVLMVTDASLPGIQRWYLNWSNIKVPRLHLSQSGYLRITLLPLLTLIFTGTVHILITFDPVLIDAHFTSSWLLAVGSVVATSLVPFFDFFFSILIPHSIAGCRPLLTSVFH